MNPMQPVSGSPRRHPLSLARSRCLIGQAVAKHIDTIVRITILSRWRSPTVRAEVPRIFQTVRVKGFSMHDNQLLSQLISRLDRNQMALQAALEEVALWIRQRGSEAVADNITGALEALTENADFIAQGIVKLTAGVDGSQPE